MRRGCLRHGVARFKADPPELLGMLLVLNLEHEPGIIRLFDSDPVELANEISFQLTNPEGDRPLPSPLVLAEAERLIPLLNECVALGEMYRFQRICDQHEIGLPDREPVGFGWAQWHTEVAA